MNCTLSLDGIFTADTLELLIGDKMNSLPAPICSVVIEHERTVSGEPNRPIRQRGLVARIAHVFAERKYRRAYQEWADAGFPDRVQTSRTFIPRARIETA